MTGAAAPPLVYSLRRSRYSACADRVAPTAAPVTVGASSGLGPAAGGADSDRRIQDSDVDGRRCGIIATEDRPGRAGPGRHEPDLGGASRRPLRVSRRGPMTAARRPAGRDPAGRPPCCLQASTAQTAPPRRAAPRRLWRRPVRVCVSGIDSGPPPPAPRPGRIGAAGGPRIAEAHGMAALAGSDSDSRRRSAQGGRGPREPGAAGGRPGPARRPAGPQKGPPGRGPGGPRATIRCLRLAAAGPLTQAAGRVGHGGGSLRTTVAATPGRDSAALPEPPGAKSRLSRLGLAAAASRIRPARTGGRRAPGPPLPPSALLQAEK